MNKDGKSILICTKPALLQAIIHDRGIDLWDYKRIQDVCLPPIVALSSGGKISLKEEYDKYHWKGELKLNTGELEKTYEYLQGLREGISGYLKDCTPECKLIPMAKLKDKVNSIPPENILDIEYCMFLNSAYYFYNIPITVGEWMNAQLEKLDKDIKQIEWFLGLNEEECEEEFSYSWSDKMMVIESFLKMRGGTPFNLALKTVVQTLETKRQERAYLWVLEKLLEIFGSGNELKYWRAGVKSLKERESFKVELNPKNPLGLQYSD